MLDEKRFGSLSKDEQKALTTQVITEESPGFILKDFQTLIDFVRGKNLQLSGINNSLPMSSLSSINSKLQQPIEVSLKRAQQKSYPNINGLYWLLRSTGLAYVKTDSKKAILVVDEQALSSWNTLNPTERYFNLLEAWVLYASVELTGENLGSMGVLYHCLNFFEYFKNKTIKVAEDKNAESRLRYSPGLVNLSLLNAFGLMKVEQAKPFEGKGWTINKIDRTLFGDALLKCLYKSICLNEDMYDSFILGDSSREVVFGQLQEAFKGYFPEWSNNLILPETEQEQATYIFKVFLDKKIWRKISISTEDVLESLANIILEAFEFDYDHLYRFIYKDRFGRTININHPYTEEDPLASEVKIGELSLKLGQTMIYNYDFGDDWEFGVLLEAIEAFDPNLSEPKIIDSQGKSPDQYPDSDGWDDDGDDDDDDDEEYDDD
ncbi:MAG: plasmid pRiA4b ORF-3 family protein [Acidobacteria bacterium]|nr:plasmid pRiA4b ORF-3 family protein [Acidobacteriota bacterium]